MNYRHLYHAGNIGDVFKHATLLFMLQCMLKKEGAVTVVDTHAGRGLYDLDADEAQRTQEALLGIHKAARADDMLLAPYLNVVAAFNPKDELRYYPGSPAFVAHTLRPEDLLILNELHPEEALELKSVFKGDKQVQIHSRDGYELWAAMTPPKTSRGLYLIDPPFEKPDEFQRMTQTLVETQRKCKHAVVMMWYPIKERPALWRWHEQLVASGVEKMMLIEHTVYTEERSDRFNGSGFIVVNPPFSFQQEFPPLGEAIKNALKIEGQNSNMKTEWLRA
jgi:23S rRNA (adenine2030-N6)-methyltransferase